MGVYALSIQELTGKLPASIRMVQLGDQLTSVPLRMQKGELAQAREAIDRALTWLRSNAAVQ